MKRALVLSVALPVLASGTVTADAAPTATRRTVTVAYDQVAVYHLSCGDCTEVSARPGEHSVVVEVVDDVSPSGHVDVAWTSRRGESGPHYFTVCGRTAEPQAVPAGRALGLYPWAHPGPDCPGSLSTTGTIRLTFLGDR